MPDPVNLSNDVVALTTMSNALAGASALASQEFEAAAARRTTAADEIKLNTEYVWLNSLVTPTNLAAKAMQRMDEAGSGAARFVPYPPPYAIQPHPTQASTPSTPP